MMDMIVHFISRDKFTAGYIEFMKVCFPEYEHYFFTNASDSQLNIYNDDNVYYYRSAAEIFLKPGNIAILRRCSKIIISGVFISWKTKALMVMSGLIRKTYLHFWGGDFYCHRSKYSIKHARHALGKILQHCMIKNCAGTINLIEPDIEKLCEIFPNNTKHFVAPMKGSPLRKIDFQAIRVKPKDSNAFRITIGNSAFTENQHIEAFHLLEHLKNENIEIFCPLSYGIPAYRDEVIAEGRRIFGEKFRPITEFMSFEEYTNLLASCSAGVFNNNRQQGMGNISLLIRLGKKVYIRDDTAMWQHFRHNMKYYVYPVSELDGITIEQLADFPQELAYNNIHIAEEYAAGDQAVQQWRKVFED